jgi:hypothetical protein
MILLQRALGYAVLILIPALLLLLWRRSLIRLCYTFPVYLAAVWLGDVAIAARPERFFNWGFFVTKQTLYGALKFAIAVEIATLAFGRFPGALAVARRALLAGLIVTLATLVFGPPIKRWAMVDVGMALQPRLANGTVLVLLIVWVLVLWYHVPVHRLHRAIIRGLVPYMLFFGDGLVIQFYARHSHLHQLTGLLDSAAYLTVLAYWTWEAWRRVDEPTPSDAVSPLLSWRARL